MFALTSAMRASTGISCSIRKERKSLKKYQIASLPSFLPWDAIIDKVITV
jgi:hypothetical protein